jgi:anti-sigma regulatory factor (Ser/Thr protein kinase)
VDTLVDETEETAQRLTLSSRLAEIERIPPWIDSLALRYAIPENSRFAMNLCLEEALSNIIRHGYSGDPHHSITVEFQPLQDRFVLTVEDEAPPFNPVEAPESPMVSPGNDGIGGQGIRLLHNFASTLEYQPTPCGNRLKIGFL